MKAMMHGGWLAAALLCIAGFAAFADDCEPHWDNAIGQPGMDDRVFALTVFDDGSGGGPALYAGGQFSTAGAQPANRVAKWDGSSWSPLGNGILRGQVEALTVFDDGSGGAPALYAGGTFTKAGDRPASRIAKWDGTSWSPLGAGVGGQGRVSALAVFDDGTGGGPGVYAAGLFSKAGGVTVKHIAKWDGSSWSALGEGVNVDGQGVRALAVFDDGTGDALYVGSTTAWEDGQLVWRIAKWDGSSWSYLPIALPGRVESMTVFDDGSGGGPALYAAGWWSPMMVKWDGDSVSLVSGANDLQVYSLTVFDDGSGEAIYAGGFFHSVDGVHIPKVAKWDGASWSPLGAGLNWPVYAMAAFDDGLGEGPALFVGGQFTSAGGEPANRIATWRGCASDSGCIFADLNCDGVVDHKDLVILVQSFGPCSPQHPGSCPADLNGDDVVNAKDLQILLGEMTPGTPGSPGKSCGPQK